MEYKYSKTYTVQFRDVDTTTHMTTNAVVDYMQEVAGEHAHTLGLDLFGDESELFWVVSRAKVYMEHYPTLGEKIKFVTYPAGIDKLFLVRRTDIYNQADEKIGYTIGYYILVDIHTGRPLRPVNLPEHFEPFIQKYEGESLAKIKNATEITHEDCRKVRYSEIDVNKHMNNANYIRWGLDMISVEELSNHPVRSIQTNYLKALVEGDEVKITRGIDEEGNSIIWGTSLDEKIVYWSSLIKLSE